MAKNRRHAERRTARTEGGVGAGKDARGAHVDASASKAARIDHVIAGTNQHARAAHAHADAGARTAARVDYVDAARGLAILMMFAYHFCFDLNYFGIIQQDFYNDVRWIAWRTVILSSFLLLVGVGLALAHATRWSWPGYWRRLGQIAVCALLVSIGSYFAFPQSWIYFGVLHHIVVATLLAVPLLKFPRAALALGIVLVGAGAWLQHAFFDAKVWHWFGLMTFKPRTEDYVPLLPWFGVVSMGVWLGDFLAQPQRLAPLARWRARGGLTRTLCLAGRHSLLLYMLHQPVFIAALTLLLGMPGAH